MSLYCDPDDFWLCPFHPDHRVLAKRFQYHIIRCAKAHPHIRRVKCSFNATHLTTPEDLYKHMSTCPDNQTVHNAIAKGMKDFNWGDSNSETSETKAAILTNGEDWDREVHPVQIFNEDELQQLKKQNEFWSSSVTPADMTSIGPSRPQSSYYDRELLGRSRPVTASPKQIGQTIASFEPKRSSALMFNGVGNTISEATLDSQFENIRRNMLATGVGRGRLPIIQQSEDSFNSRSVPYISKKNHE